MRRRLLAIAAGLAWLCVATEATAQVTTPLSAATPEAGHAQFELSTGFPYMVTANAGIGISRRFELSALGRIAWQDVQRFGLEARIRLNDPSKSYGFALKVGADSWTGRPAPHSDGSNPWLDITGLQDFTGWLDAVASMSTLRGTVLSASVGVELVGDHSPPTTPLQGTPPFIAWGTNITARIAAELPLKGRLLLVFEIGADLHLTGFDTATIMPEAALGLAYTL